MKFGWLIVSFGGLFTACATTGIFFGFYYSNPILAITGSLSAIGFFIHNFFIVPTLARTGILDQEILISRSKQ